MTSKKPSSNSPFGPLFLIAIGAIWLLSNLGIVPSFNWGALFRLWPVFLILAGLNMIVQQRPTPLTKLLSTLIGMIALGVVGLALMFGDALPFFGRNAQTVENQPFNVLLDEAETAQIRIDIGSTPANIETVLDSTDLVAGTVSHTGMLDVDVSTRNDERVVDVSVRDQGGWMSFGSLQFDPWQIALNGQVPTDLRIDSGSGAVDLALNAMELTNFDLDAGSGSVSAELPGGRYNANIDLASGASQLTLPLAGNGVYEIDAGSGSVTLRIPQGAEVKVVVDEGSGGFSADDRFARAASEGGDSVWKTANYDHVSSNYEIRIDQGSGSVRVERVGGR